MSPTATPNRLLQEVGSPPDVPTQSKFNHLLANLEPEKLVEMKNQLKNVLKKKQDDDDYYKVVVPTERVPKDVLKHRQGVKYETTAISEPETHCKQTQILEMELIKLKGQFHRNRTATMNFMKKWNDERTMVKESIKELTASRREELQLIDVVKRDNLELIHKKHQLELDLIEMSEKIEYLQGNLNEAMRKAQEKDSEIFTMKNEKMELSSQIDILKLINLPAFVEPEPQPCCPTLSDNFDTERWSQFLPSNVFSVGIILLISSLVIYFYIFSHSSSVEISESVCEDCDYERVSLRQ